MGFTRPDEAVRFVEETGVDALAVAIGTAHGFYKSEPKLRLDLLEEIRAATDCSLVLHGSSGVPSVSVAAAIQRGISKVNLATEIKNAFMRTLQRVLRDNEEIDLRKVFPEAIEVVTALVSEKFKLMDGALETAVD
jgi:fructose-bisphosphate aldolase class II/tagatose 1,6-diphosphate aldolase GatY/KbaY